MFPHGRLFPIIPLLPFFFYSFFFFVPFYDAAFVCSVFLSCCVFVCFRRG